MRRLWAHIVIAFAAIVTVFATLPSMLSNDRVKTNGEYETRRQFTFQLFERQKEDDDDVTKELTNTSAKEMAKIMEQRLINYNISSYDITTSGNKDVDDIITVTFSTESNEKYNQVITYLTFSGSFAFVNTNNDLVEEDTFKRGNAYLKDVSVNEYPVIILPVKTDSPEWELLVNGAVEHPITKESDDEEGESTSKAVIYMIYNYQKGDTYQTLTEKEKFEEKKFMEFEFDPENPDSLYYNKSKNSLSQVCGYVDANGNGVADATEIRSAFNQADFYLNLFNSSSLDYDVKCIRGLASGTEVWVDAKIESVIREDNRANWNSTLTAALAGIVIVSLLLVVFYRLGALSGAVTTLLSVYLSLGFMIIAGMEYNALAVVAFVLVAIVALTSSIIYNNKLKEDAYRGHTLKKANTEASKKSLLPIIDIHVVSLIVGLFAYLLGGAALHSFGAILTIGSIISVILSTFGLKGMMWLITNATALNGKYEFFGINSENVPNHMAEEKQRYFGPYADKDLSSKKKPVGIISLALFGLSLIGVVVASSLGAGSIYKKTTSKVIDNQIYIQNKIVVKDEDSESPLNDTTLYDEILNKIQLISYDKDNAPVYTKLAEYVSSFKEFAVEESLTEEDVTTKYRTTYYVISLKEMLKKDTPAQIVGETESDLTIDRAINEFFDLHPLFKNSVSNNMSLKDVTTYVSEEYTDWQKVTLATSIAMLVLTLYLCLRYRLSRGLATLGFEVAANGVALGLITLLSAIGASIPATVSITLPIVTVLSYFFMIIFMNRERELILDDKSRDTSIAHREELATKAMGMAYAPILATAVIGIYLLINFFGFGTASASYIYLFAIVASLLALGAICVLFVPVSNYLYRAFNKLFANHKPREHKNKKKVVVKKSAEPEEAIFIGIND